MSATTGRLEGARRRRRSITPRAIAGMSIRRGTLRTSAAFCRLTPIAATTDFTIPRGRRGRSSPPCVGPMREGSSSNLSISARTPAAAKARPRSRRWRWRRSSALTRCSISSVASTGLPPTSVCASGDRDQVSRARRRSYRACEALMSC